MEKEDLLFDVVTPLGNKSADATLTSGQIPNVLNPITVP